MPINVQGPDGSNLAFPDGTPEGDIVAAMDAHYGAAKDAKNVSHETPAFDKNDPRFSGAGAVGGKFLEGALGLGAYVPQAGAALSALAHPLTGVGKPGESFSERYAANLPEEQAASKAFEAENPNISTGLKIAGGAASLAPAIAAAPAAFGVGGASIPVSMAAGAGTSGAIGVVDALARGDDPLKAGMLSAAGGAAGPLIGKGVGAGIEKLLDSSVAKANAGNELANAAERLGVDFPKVAASDSLVTQRAGAALKEIPLIGDPIVSASRKASEQMGDALSRVEQGYGSGSAFNAGDVAKTGLVDWITGKSKDVMNRLYGTVDQHINPSVTRPLTATEQMAGKILSERLASKAPDAGKAVDLVTDALPATSPQGLTYEGLKTLRTRIGSYLDGSILPEAGTSMPDLKRIYGALTEDLKATVFDAGGAKGLAAFNRANDINKLVSQRRESLAKVVGVEADAAPEKVIDRLIAMASGNSRADLTKFMLARKTIGGKDWDEVASAAVSKIGRDAEGNFSPDRFLTAWGKFSQTGKNLLFGQKNDLAQALEDIALLSSKAKQLGAFGNPSGTSRVLGPIGILGAGISAPMAAIPAAVGARGVAHLMARSIRPKAVTMRVAAQNADVAKMLESVTSGGIVGASGSNLVLPRTPAQTAQPSPIPIQ